MFQWGRLGLKRILSILKEFEAASGLQINIKNTAYDNWWGWGENWGYN